jgi:phosphomethylpyrimidine synthase
MKDKTRLTQIDAAREGILTAEMQKVAQDEGLRPEKILAGIGNGQIVICSNYISSSDKKKVCGVGTGLRTKVNANIGTSRDRINIEEELAKLRACEEAGADAVMDLSTGGDLTDIRKHVIRASTIPVGTVPVYEVLHTACASGKTVADVRPRDFLDAVEKHAQEGVDFVTVHCGLTFDAVLKIKSQGRLNGIVSRGGAFHAQWMVTHQAENPLFDHFDELIAIARKYDIVLSLGDGLRPGALRDATDRGQVQELITLGELQKRAFDAGVQVIIEGPGHVPLDQIEMNMALQKRLCNNAPFYVLGPLVTDVAPGYDHIVSAIGGAVAARYGADFLCYVTPAEHLGLPSADDVREGVIAARIAAHAGDIVKLGERARMWDDRMSEYRQKRDWQGQIRLALDPLKARTYHEQQKAHIEDTCTMCGEYCSYRVSEKTFQDIACGKMIKKVEK